MRAFVIALVAGLVVGAAIVGPLWWTSADDDQGSLAQQACAATPSTIATGDAVAHGRLVGASELASAAALSDPKYRPLQNALHDAVGEHGIASTPAAIKPRLDAVHGVCRDLKLET
jgi:hypothetical protein